MGLRGSQEYRWVTIGPGAQQEMEEWLQYLDASTPCVSPFQLQWNQHQLVLSHGGLQWEAEVSNRGPHVKEREERMASAQPKYGTGKSSERGRPSGGGRGRTRMVPSTVATGAPSGDKFVRIVTCPQIFVATEKVHGRAWAPSRQTRRVAANEVRSRAAPRKGADLSFLLSQTGISKRDVTTYS